VRNPNEDFRVWVDFSVTRVAAVLGGAIVLSVAQAQASAAVQTSAQARNPPTNGTTSPYEPDRFAGRAGRYYKLIWGVDSLGTKWTESGEVIRFSYRVIDPIKARALNDKQAEPALNSPRAGVSLVVPKMENIGQLRQTGVPEAGKSYWIAFSNKGRLIRRGDRVNVVVGAFHADGLVVD
jgi:hypothetical protein